MKRYFKYLFILIFAIFSFYYTDRVIYISKYNDAILASINDYADKYNTICSEGSINEDGVILGLSGISVNKSKSYSNMKGIGFKEELIEFEKNECILNKKNNFDKYIISGNEVENNISIIINVNTGKYYKDMLEISYMKNIELNLLLNSEFLEKNIIDIENKSNILFKGSSKDELEKFINILHKEIYCVKTNDYEVLNICKKEKINSIKMNYIIQKDLLTNIKYNLSSGHIIFIDENKVNLNELSASINYILKRGYKIVSINELLSA